MRMQKREIDIVPEATKGKGAETAEESREEEHEQIRIAQRRWAYVRKNNPEVEIVVHPQCREILKSNMSASKKIEEMVNIFLAEYPTYILPEDEDLHHPSYLSKYLDIPMWLVEQCGDVIEFCRLRLKAAKEWFPAEEDSKLKGAFCVGFEGLGLVSHLGEAEEMKPIWDEYYSWLGYKR